MTSTSLSSKLLDREVLISLFLLILCAVLWSASFEIREPDYGQLSPATWPRIIIAILSGLSLVYLVQSLRAADNNKASQSVTDSRTSTDSSDNQVSEQREPGLQGFYQYWRNVIWCFTLFGLYLYTLPWLGMLVGASSFVFLLLCALGGWQPRKLLLHAVIALLTVGGMWSLFTYALGVLLPSGTLFEGL